MTRTYTRPPPLIDVLQEHLEEAAFLYSARKHCLTRPELSWENLPSREKRLEAHLHGLILGGIHTARLLKGKLTLDADGDPGEAFVAGAVYPSLGLVEPMEWLAEAIAADVPHHRAIVEGLIYGNNKSLEPWLGDYLVHESPCLRAASAEVLGRCYPSIAESRLTPLLDDPAPRVLLAASGAFSAPPAPKKLLPLLQSGDADITDGTARLLLRAGDREVLGILRNRLKASDSALSRKLVLLLAISGDAGDAQLILDVLTRQPEVAPEALRALGLVGSPAVSEHLISRLDKPAQEGEYLAACQALQTLTGKDHLPQFDLEEPPPGAIAAFQDLWRKWYRETGARYTARDKCRLGRPLSPAVLLADLCRRGNPVRDLSFLELKFRYACPVDLHHDARYTIQVMQVNQIKAWVERADAAAANPRTRAA